MGAKYFLFAVISLLIVVVSVDSVNVESVLNNVPELERLDFLRYHLRIGYQLSIRKSINTYDEQLGKFSLELYNWAKNKYALNNLSVPKQTREIVCMPDGTCIDIGDIGVHPS